jgi:hypothetical protein
MEKKVVVETVKGKPFIHGNIDRRGDHEPRVAIYRRGTCDRELPSAGLIVMKVDGRRPGESRSATAPGHIVSQAMGREAAFLTLAESTEATIGILLLLLLIELIHVSLINLFADIRNCGDIVVA